MANSMALPMGFGNIQKPKSDAVRPSSSNLPSALSERRFLNEMELSSRWGIPASTLRRWRMLGRGPVFAKFSKKVAYPLDGKGGVIDYEQTKLYVSTSERVPE